VNLKRISSVAVGLLAFAGVTAASASSAYAVDSYTLGCTGGSVKATKSSAGFGYIKITVRNGCRDARRVKVYVANNTDTACLSYSAGQSRSFTYSWPSDLDRIAFC
jgi:hypothetical protein